MIEIIHSFFDNDKIIEIDIDKEQPKEYIDNEYVVLVNNQNVVFQQLSSSILLILSKYTADYQDNILVTPENSICVHFGKNASQSYEMHRHNYIEMVYLIDGETDYIIQDQYYRYQKGDICIINQNVRHMEILKECCAEKKNLIMGFGFRKFFDNFYKSLIVLANPKTVVNDRYAPKEIKNQVLRADQLVAVIKKMEADSGEIASSKKQMKERAESLLSKTSEKRKDYVEKYKKIIEEVKSKKEEGKEETQKQEETLICPKCGATMVLRVAKKGEKAGKKFYGCSQVPKCRFIMNIEQ